jgi:hypothetical protein
MNFEVALSPTTEADLERRFDFLPDRAETSAGRDRRDGSEKPLSSERS